MSEYEYELRKNGAVIATGRIQLDRTPAQGEELTLGSTRARVETVLPFMGGRHRVILEQS